MSYDVIVRTEEEIEELVGQCDEQEAKGVSAFFSMTYEQGLLAAILWLTDLDGEHPIDEE